MFCYIQNDLHYTLLMDEVTKVKHTLWMGTADLKDLYVKYGRFAMPFLSLLEKKIKQGLSIRLLHAKEPGENFRNDFDMYPALWKGLERALCPRIHFKLILFDYLSMLASIVLPTQILDYFSIVGISQTSTEIHISLDEKMHPELSKDVHFESKGFMEAVSVTDFPIRDHKVILKIRRRRWTDTRTGKSFSIPIDLDIVAKGTRYSKEFGAFLKETYGDVPRDLPYA